MIMDAYADFLKKVTALREEMVTEIKAILHSKGWSVGDKVMVPGTANLFEICSDRLLVNGRHTDGLETDEILSAIRSAIHVLPKSFFE
jgi:hypothetical protein